MNNSSGQRILRRHTPTAYFEAPEIATLSKTLYKLRTQFSRTELQRLALADAQDFTFTEAQLTRDIIDLRLLGSLTALITHHNEKQKQSGCNEEERISAYLADDVNYPKIYDIVHNGATAGTDPAFAKHERSAPFRELHKRMETVYHSNLLVKNAPTYTWRMNSTGARNPAKSPAAQ